MVGAHAGGGLVRLLFWLAVLVAFVVLVEARMAGAGPPGVRAYARVHVLARWPALYQWRAFDSIISRESGWNPCAHWPHESDCGYRSSNSCGLPQANPCPAGWRGRLWSTRFLQVLWGIGYIAGRYGDPAAALAYWNSHGSY